MRYDPIPADLFIANRLRLAKLMKTASVAILVSNDAMPRNGDQYFPYRQNSDLFYLCGIEQPGTV
ncbi:MAG: aminopeptidase P family protein, partial [Bacteroidia bacterium]|nr:aminopeptidase P family protein [Bacteroidia bacterium]